jgi:hypothetical protein
MKQPKNPRTTLQDVCIMSWNIRKSFLSKYQELPGIPAFIHSYLQTNSPIFPEIKPWELQRAVAKPRITYSPGDDQIWEKATVIAILKPQGGDRPTALLSQMAKILKRIVNSKA